MKILQINTSDLQGGAARAMYRLHQALGKAGHRSRLLTRTRQVRGPETYTIQEVAGSYGGLLGRLHKELAVRADIWFGIPNLHGTTKRLLHTDLFRWADVIQLHNLHGRFFNYHLLPRITAAKPVVWTLHDMWAFTGHCAYAYDCRRWQTGCYACPLLVGEQRQLVEPGPTLLDRTRTIWRRKRNLYGQSSLHLVTPSRWLGNLASDSILAQAGEVEVIPNGVDLHTFAPMDPQAARACLGLPAEAKVILFVAEKLSNRRKGFDLLLEALAHLPDLAGLELLTIGTVESREALGRFRCRELGRLDDEGLMSLAYNAADLFVFPTLADNQPLVVLESLACGTPIVSFDIGGVPEMVRPMETGFLADYRDPVHLARGISVLLEDEALCARLGRRCRAIAVAEYGLELQSKRYQALYQRAIEEHRHQAKSEDRFSAGTGEGKGVG
ncbi:MAG: glycosyltransferase family 4 protein [Anaerolineae bacterium]|jgi:glycosyltransferase involved in cell wall biosynthesis